MITSSVQDGDLVGTFGVPERDGPYPGVLALGGSEGGIAEYLLRLLVPEGFACLALAYFDAPGTQPSLIEVPLERVERGSAGCSLNRSLQHKAAAMPSQKRRFPSNVSALTLGSRI